MVRAGGSLVWLDTGAHSAMSDILADSGPTCPTYLRRRPLARYHCTCAPASTKRPKPPGDGRSSLLKPLRNTLEQKENPQLGQPAANLATPCAASGAAFAATRFVLVEPSHPGNVGAAARALKTMGFGQLLLVRPRVPEVLRDPEAIAMASGADDVLSAARVLGSLEEALVGVQWSLALSARPREYGPPIIMPRVAAAQAKAILRDAEAAVALVFGNERTGLANEDVDRCSAIAHVPANPVYTSLNLAQAVQVLAYELRLAYLDGANQAPETGRAPAQLASSDEIEGMFVHLEQALTALDFFDPSNPKKLQPRLRSLFARTGLEREEVNILRGIAKHILLKIKP